MLRRPSLALLTTFFLAAGAGNTFALAAPAPTAKLVPTKVAINKKATLLGSHFQAKETYTVLLAIPNLQHAKTKRFVGVGRTDGRGNLHLTLKMPVISFCGASSLYVYSLKHPKMVRASFTLTGCTAAIKAGKIPPPPTAPGKKP